MSRLSNKEFLSGVSKLLASANESQSSIYFTQKRYIAYDEVTGKQSPPPNAVNDSVPVPSEVSAPVTISKDATSYPILIRATNGASKKDKKIKYSTVVENKDLEDFWKEYANVLKNGITGLKKKDKKKNKKKKTKAGVSK